MALNRQEALSFLRSRSKRDNTGFLEEVRQANNFERECIEETCNFEEAYEVFDDLMVNYNEYSNEIFKKIYQSNHGSLNPYESNYNTQYTALEHAENFQNLKNDPCGSKFRKSCVSKQTKICRFDKITFKIDCECRDGFVGDWCEQLINDGLPTTIPVPTPGPTPQDYDTTTHPPIIQVNVTTESPDIILTTQATDFKNVTEQPPIREEDSFDMNYLISLVLFFGIAIVMAVLYTLVYFLRRRKKNSSAY